MANEAEYEALRQIVRERLQLDLRRQFFTARTLKMKRAAHAGIQATPRGSALLDGARVRLASLPAGFTDWVWDEPPSPDGATDLLGPIEPGPVD